MSNGGCAFAVRNFHLVFGDYRTRQRCPQQIFVFVHGARLQRTKHVFSQEFLAEILYNHFAGPSGICFFNHGFEVISLADVANHGDHIVGIIFLQPRNDDGRI